MNQERRHEHTWRAILESFVKNTITCGLAYMIIVHVYTTILIACNGLLPETTWTTLFLDAFLLGGLIALIICSRLARRGPMFEWLAYFAATVIVAYFIIWQIEYFNAFDDEGMIFFTVPTIFIYIWVIMALVSAGYIILVIPVSIVRFAKKKTRVKINRSNKHRMHTFLLIAIPLASMGLALPVTGLYISEGTVKRTVSHADMNTDCKFAIWDRPDISAQNGSTQDIDLNLLTENETRILTALGKMNTTFFGQIGFNTPTQVNRTIAFLKLLDAFNLTMCITIWYSPEVMEQLDSEFPTAHYPEDWINNARATLEFVIDNDITSVIGICADSEKGGNVNSLEEYWENIEIYDAFLQEVQTNASLRNPRPGQDTFKTVLCFGPDALVDFMDGDQDMVVRNRMLGLPPVSWTDYHFMLYRGHPSANTAVLYNFLILMERYLGLENTAPIVGLTGVEWFAEGYYDGTYHVFGKRQAFDYDGIDGWEAMKREILVCKAMGFDTVSVFHLNKYVTEEPAIENYGMLDYYGIEAIEDLAAEWNQPKTIVYPISSLDVKLSARGFFSPVDELQYDLVQNIEMLVVQIVLFCLIGIFTVLSLIKRRKSQMT